MKGKIRVAAVLLCLFAGWLLIPYMEISPGDIQGEIVRYVALGDSIARGYGLQNPEQESYVAVVRNELDSENNTVFCYNLGQDGLDSEDLLNRLTDRENSFYAQYTAKLKGADVVTISIGSNDLLHLITEGSSMIGIILGGDSIFRETADKFASNYKKIVGAIHEISPGAAIYANNVYNPVRYFEHYKEFDEVADEYISLLNKGFSLDEQADYVNTVDVKSVFDEADERVINDTTIEGQPDPHPNKVGHEKIAEAVIKKMSEKKTR